MAIHILQGIIPINPTSKSSALDDSNFMYLSTILKPIDHYSTGGIGDPKLSKKPHKYIPLVLGWTIKRSTGELKGNVSYSKINADNEIPDPDNYEIKHKIEITSGHFVELDNQVIAIAPLKKTKAFKEKFCKAIVWSLMNDPECLKDKLKEISFSDTLEIPAQVIPAGFIPWLNVTITEECIV